MTALPATLLTPDTPLLPLLKGYPFLIDFLAQLNPRYGKLKNPLMRATVGRFATLGKVATMGDVPRQQLLEAIRVRIVQVTGDRVDVQLTPVSGDASPAGRAQRVEQLRDIIDALHHGLPADEAKRRFDSLVGDTDATEIAEMEQALIRGGMPVSEIQRLCDLHVGVVRDALGEAPPVAPPGHPVHTYLADNTIITALAEELGTLVAALGEPPDRATLDLRYRAFFKNLEMLRGIDNHYVRKENELFARLERHGVTGPSQVMWGVHDQLRARFAATRQALEQRDPQALATLGAALSRDLVEMVFKENQILFPLALHTLDDDEWAQVRHGEDVLGYHFTRPSAAWPAPADDAPAQPTPADATRPPDLARARTLPPIPGNALGLGCGALNVEQLDLILKVLPIDLTFVDADGFVRYYSDNPERIFPRSPGAIGRHVDGCHPPQSLHKVRAVLDAFAAGTQSSAEFWIEHRGRFVHIRYLAIRDDAGAFLGTLEVTQDLTELRALTGQRRLLDWDSGAAPP